MTTPSTTEPQPQPADIIALALMTWKPATTPDEAVRAASGIVFALEQAGYQITDGTISGADLTEGAGPDSTCGCGEPITKYQGVWLHLFNEELRGTDDHDARPGDELP